MGRKTELKAGLSGRPPTAAAQLQFLLLDRASALLAGLHSEFFYPLEFSTFGFSNGMQYFITGDQYFRVHDLAQTLANNERR